MHILQAIITKYHGPSGLQGSRVSAKCSATRIMLQWDDALNREQNHKAAADELMRRMKWDASHKVVGGGCPDDSYCWVQIPKEITL